MAYRNSAISKSINLEIQRFESVHPCIYAVYDLVDEISDAYLQNKIREHIVSIEGMKAQHSPHSSYLIKHRSCICTLWSFSVLTVKRAVRWQLPEWVCPLLLAPVSPIPPLSSQLFSCPFIRLHLFNTPFFPDFYVESFSCRLTCIFHDFPLPTSPPPAAPGSYRYPITDHIMSPETAVTKLTRTTHRPSAFIHV